MGLLDSILGNMTGAGGSAPQTRSSATSPMVKALMMLLAAKAYQHYRSRPQGGAANSEGGLGDLLGGRSNPQGGATTSGGGLGDLLGGGRSEGAGSGMPGGLGGMLSGGLGGLLGGLAGSGGLGGLIDQFRQRGYGDHVDSWVGTGQNRNIDPDDLGQALGPDTIDELEQQTGMPRSQLLSELSQELPDAVDQFTPEGRLPTEQEISSRWV